jgi:uncharacterized protein
MRLHLHGGFAEKGRMSVGIETPGARLLLDAGINTSTRGRDYYPAIDAATLARTDAILITHAHEDHIAGLGWCLSQGFRGRVLMTGETRADMDACLAAYAEPEDRARASAWPIELFRPGDTLAFADCVVETGRSGHAVGGVWFRVTGQGGPTVLYCGDTVPHSAVLAMDEPPASDVLLFDASYGRDMIPASARIEAILAWVAAASRRCLLPTPLIGRSLDLVALMAPGVAIHRGMRAGLAQQIGDGSWMRDGVARRLRDALASAADWDVGDPFPDLPLLTDDGMGIAGPSAVAIPRAIAEGVPILATGHLPAGSPGERALAAGHASWIRLPTHPTWPETLDQIAACRPRLALGHSCEGATLAAMLADAPPPLRSASTGDTIDLGA